MSENETDCLETMASMAKAQLVAMGLTVVETKSDTTFHSAELDDYDRPVVEVWIMHPANYWVMGQWASAFISGDTPDVTLAEFVAKKKRRNVARQQGAERSQAVKASEEIVWQPVIK